MKHIIIELGLSEQQSIFGGEDKWIYLDGKWVQK